MNNSTEAIEIKDAQAFEAAMNAVEFGSPLYFDLTRHFADEMRKAVSHGRTCTTERMVLLYPIFREINIEMDEINVYWEKERRKTSNGRTKN